jgi:hypothetical protein
MELQAVGRFKDPLEVDPDDYTNSLVSIAFRKGLLSQEQVTNIQAKLVSALAQCTQSYTRKESSSVKVEAAQAVFKSMIYNIDIFLKDIGNPDQCLGILLEQDLYSVYEKGIEITKVKVESAKQVFEQVKNLRIDTDNIAYNDTINTMLDFFTHYDVKFGAHEIPVSIDYPLAVEMKNSKVGIHYISEYVNRLYIENMFCSYFDFHDITRLLNGYSVVYGYNARDMMENLFLMVLTNAIGFTFFHPNETGLSILSSQCYDLQKNLESVSEEKRSKLIKDKTDEILKRLSITHKNHVQYILYCSERVSKSVQHALQSGNLEKVFIESRDSELSKDIRFKDADKMDDDTFRKLTEQIGDCDDIKQKVRTISEHVQSFEDFVDLLSADCFFDDEFITVFESLKEFELALLLKKVLDSSGERSIESLNLNTNLHLSESEKQWQKRFVCYLKELDTTRYEEILSISKNICDQ